MLAPNFLSADELGITPSQRDALIKVLGQLERGEFNQVHISDNIATRPYDEKDFTMRDWRRCICGHARRHAEFPDSAISETGPMGTLFYRTSMTMEQAAVALRDFLTGAR